MRSVPALRRQALLGAGLFTLAACAASDNTANTPPVVTEDGTVIQRNLLMSDLYIGSPGNALDSDGERARAKNEVFRMASVTTSQAVSLNGDGFAPDGRERYEESRSLFTAETTLTYTAADNGFSFTISDGVAGTYTIALNDLLFMNPSEAATVEFAQFGKLYASNRGFFRSSIDLAEGSWVDYANAVETLPEEEQEYINARVSELLQFENFRYDVVTPTHEGYLFTTKGNVGVRIDAVAIGSFELTELATGNDIQSHFVFGHRTPGAEMPLTGTARHEGRIVGSVLTNNSVRSLTGSSFLDVNFATGFVDLELASVIRESSNNEGVNTFFDYRTIGGTGRIDGNRFSGELLDTDTASTGAFDGSFFGPRANEFGGTFYFGNEGGYATGAIAGAEQESTLTN